MIFPRSLVRGVVAGLAAVAATGCATLGPRGLIAEAPLPAAPERVAELPLETPSPTPPVDLPEHLLEPDATFTLADVVDIALRHNPVTRASYLDAVAAAADLGSTRAAYYPRIDLSASLSRSQQSAFGGQIDFLQTSYGPTVDLSWLVLDIGGRAADAEAARLDVLTADWTHTRVVQDVILAVQQTFVGYVNAKAQLEAARVGLTEAEAALEAASVRHDAGVATIADVLQARTARSQAQLAVDTFSGEVLTLRGALATAMGLPATLPYDVGELPDDLPVDKAAQAVEPLIDQARKARPDLAAARISAGAASGIVTIVPIRVSPPATRSRNS